MQDMLNLVAQRSKTALIPEPETSTTTEAATETPVIALATHTAEPEPIQQTGKKEPAPEKGTPVNYVATFLQPLRERKSRAVYISDDAHSTLQAIAQVSDGIPLADLLGNIVNHHFETYGPDIRAFMAEQEKKNKKRLKI